MGEWDCFFGALLTSLEDSAQSAAGIKATLLAQVDTGLVPNAAAASGITAGRSQPPVGSYLVWKVYQRIQGVVVREYQVEPSRLSFKLTSERPVHVITQEFEAGTPHLMIDGKAVGAVPIRQGFGKLSVPAGQHFVTLLQ